MLLLLKDAKAGSTAEVANLGCPVDPQAEGHRLAIFRYAKFRMDLFTLSRRR